MLSDKQIKSLISSGEMEITGINPSNQVTSCGVDLTVGHDYKRPATEEVFHAGDNNGQIVIKPDTFYLVHTREKIMLPDDVHGRTEELMRQALDGISVTTGSVDPGYSDYLVLGIENRSEKTKIIEPGEKIVQITFDMLDEPAESTYNRDSQYNQSGL